MGLSNTYSNARYEYSSGKSNSSMGGASISYQGMGSESTSDSKRNKKYGKDNEDESYTDKIKGGLNKVSDYLKTAYNKANFNDFGGFIKDKVTNQ
jgi:CRISPR/Cas system-associated protein Cas7 (RAMP superfamily)